MAPWCAQCSLEWLVYHVLLFFLQHFQVFGHQEWQCSPGLLGSGRHRLLASDWLPSRLQSWRHFDCPLVYSHDTICLPVTDLFMFMTSPMMSYIWRTPYIGVRCNVWHTCMTYMYDMHTLHYAWHTFMIYMHDPQYDIHAWHTCMTYM